MDDREDDEYDVGRVEEGKDNSGVVEAVNHESRKNRSAYMREITWEALPVEATELPALDASLRQVNIYNFQNFASC